MNIPPTSNNGPLIPPRTPRRRHNNALQPPNLLTTSLENARTTHLAVGAAQQTPTTATTLSTPFSAHPHSAYTPSGGTMSAASPMNVRHTSSFPATYNPQQWGPIHSGSPHPTSQTPQNNRVIALAPRPVGPDEPVVSPPPPYSPRREPDSQSSPRVTSNTVSPSDSATPDTDTSRHTTPLTSANALSPDFPSRQAAGRGPLTRQISSTNASPNLTSTPAFPPPPSTNASSSRLRSSSKDQASRLLSSIASRGKSNANSPVTGVSGLHVNTNQAFRQGHEDDLSSPSSSAPAARRAASTGDLSLARGSTPVAVYSSPAWEPGMPLPPPPQVPPPGSARTQSLNRPIESPALERGPVPAQRIRQPPVHGTRLETVPPTPANWQEDSHNVEQHGPRQSSSPAPLHIDTGSILRRFPVTQDEQATTTASTPAHRRRESSTGCLVRTPAVRNRSVVGLRERRSESKHGKERATSNPPIYSYANAAPLVDDEAVKPENLNLCGPLRDSFNRGDATRKPPGSGEAALSGKSVSFERVSSTHDDRSNHSSTPTPPASATEKERHASSAGAALRRSLRLPQKLSLLMPGSAEQRPISHILHTPNEDDALPVPLTPLTKTKERPTSDLLGPESPKAFAERAVERHRNFAEREAAATSDSKRLELFAQFIVAESRIRREQYSDLFELGDVDVGSLVQNLFRPVPTQEEEAREAENIPQDSSRRTSNTSSAVADSSSLDEASSMSRKMDSPSSATTNSPVQPPAAGAAKDFIPCLSPIASMSAVTGQEDEMNSRGRPPSRWWETQSQSGSVANDGFSVLGRSKRESKYMGLPRGALDSGMLFDQHGSGGGREPQPQLAQTSHHAAYGPNEYPPEKVGWHEEASVAIPPPPPNPPTPASAPPFTPDARGLDISRLITLPPPYPRHHPAVNNNHPNLSDLRAVVRSLHDVDEPESIRSKYQSEFNTKRQRADSWCEHQRSLHSQDLQYRMEHDEMTQEQFDALEVELEGKIQQSDKDIMQADFDMFQNMVVSPLHPLFSERIALATSSLEKLSRALFSDTQSRSPNMPQEEGDEQPELLEKLTQLKWLFEARETLHRRTYDLLSERNDKYKNVVLLPYKQTQNHIKVADAETFFAKDSLERRKRFERDVADRAHAFLTVIEHNVARGVEMQLDAFWQIAPSLKDSVLHKVPQEIPLDFEIRIPTDEYEENPSYHHHPLQYLYVLLGHAEKATFQFIESQINLLCLLHEIRSCALIAKCKVEVNEGRMSNGETYQQREEKRLTADLKEQVEVIEGQWCDAFGEELTSVRERVRGHLLEDGGWDDEMEDL